jgi:geranylgeranyl pyrophosphate synthase
MPEPDWPSSSEVHAAVRARLLILLNEVGGPVADVSRLAFSTKHGLLSDHPHSLTTVLVVGACLCAGASWQAALWPAVGAECMMASADLFDDAADADADQLYSAAVLLTGAAGLLSLASVAVVRVQEDGASPRTATAIVELLGAGFARAANGQAANLQRSSECQTDAVSAFRQAGAKSGPLGELIARLGARTATDDALVIQLLGDFGKRLAVRSQLLNDARDAAPDAAELKSDVRVGANTVPLAFSRSAGAPAGLSAQGVRAWERDERHRIAAAGGLAAAYALAEAERLHAIEILDRLESLARPASGLRRLVE